MNRVRNYGFKVSDFKERKHTQQKRSPAKTKKRTKAATKSRSRDRAEKPPYANPSLETVHPFKAWGSRKELQASPVQLERKTEDPDSRRPELPPVVARGSPKHHHDLNRSMSSESVYRLHRDRKMTTVDSVIDLNQQANLPSVRRTSMHGSQSTTALPRVRSREFSAVRSSGKISPTLSRNRRSTPVRPEQLQDQAFPRTVGTTAWRRSEQHSLQPKLSSEVVKDWMQHNNEEQALVNSLLPAWEAKLQKVFEEARGQPDPNVLKTAVCSDILNELGVNLTGRLSAIITPISSEILSSIYRGYPKPNPTDLIPVTPYFEVVNHLEQRHAEYLGHTAEYDSNREHVEAAMKFRWLVLKSSISARKINAQRALFDILSANAKTCLRQRLSLSNYCSRMAKWRPAPTQQNLKPFFVAWATWTKASKWGRFREDMSKIVKECDQIQGLMQADTEQVAKYEESALNEEKRLISKRESVVQQESILRELKAIEEDACAYNPSKTAQLTTKLVLHGLSLLRDEVGTALYGTRTGSNAIGNSEMGSALCIPDPISLFEGIVDPKAAEERLLDMDEQALLLFWVNYQLSQAKSSRKVDNLTHDLQDSECLLILLDRVTPKCTSKGIDVPSVGRQKVLSTVVDLELRAKHLLSAADKIDRVLYPDDSTHVRSLRKSKAADVRFVHSLIRPTDLVSSTHPDMVAAWLASMFCDRFHVFMDVDRIEKAFRQETERLQEEVRRIGDVIFQDVFSVEYVETLIQSYVVLHTQCQQLLDRVDRSTRLYESLKTRMKNFQLVALHRHFLQEPIKIIDFSRERGRLIALKEVSSGALPNLLLESLAPPEADSQMSMIQAIVSTNYETLHKIFSFYAQSALEDKSSQMNFSELWQFALDIHVAGTGHNEAQILNESDLKSVFDNVVANSDAAMMYMKKFEEMASSACIPLNLLPPAAVEDDGEEPGLGIAGFVEVLVRIAARKYPTTRRICDKFRLFLQFEVFQFARQIDLRSFVAKIRSPECLKVIKKYGKRLRRIFLFYATSNSAIDTSAAETKWSNTIDYLEFMTVVQDCRLGKEKEVKRGRDHLSGRFRGGVPLDLNEAAPYNPYLEKGYVSDKDVASIFFNIQDDQDTDKIDGDKTERHMNELTERELTYPQFLEAISALASIRYPCPYVSVAEKLVRFIDYDLLPALRRRAQMGVAGQATILKQLIN